MTSSNPLDDVILEQKQQMRSFHYPTKSKPTLTDNWARADPDLFIKLEAR